MILFRHEQIQRFEKFSNSNEREELLRELTVFAPLSVEHVPREYLDLFIAVVMKRSSEHGFTMRATITFFQEVCVLLGIGFTSDPQYELVIDVMHDSSYTDELERADLVWEDLADFLENTAGDEFEFHTAAVRRLQDFALTYKVRPQSFNDESLLALLGEIYPEKIDFIGEQAVLSLIEHARKSCGVYLLDEDVGTVSVACAMYFLGHECFSDFLFPWIRKALDGPMTLSPAERAIRLQHRFTRYLSDYLQP
ncbi:MAG: hypothetical protein SGI77_04635 [Pirellulaceae bacterium]|nr:hypothetical protein [Pirellulaceae bacterium]